MKKEKRHEKIKNNPANVRFEEAIQWLKDWGFMLERVKGSHHILRHPETRVKEPLINTRNCSVRRR